MGNPLIDLGAALLVVFTIIFIGYFLGKTNPPNGPWNDKIGIGIGPLVGRLGLPALLFRGMANINLGKVDWTVLSAMTLAKIIVFAVAALVVIIFDSAKTKEEKGKKIARTGIFGIFATQSNDIAIGLPVVAALYPEYQQYLYLGALPQMLILASTGFALMEVGKAKQKEAADDEGDGPPVKKASALTIAGNVIRGVLFNPVLFMVLLGLFFNLIVSHSMKNYTTLASFSPVFDGILVTLGGGYSVGALFLLGFGSQGKIPGTNKGKLSVLQGRALARPVFLIFLKCIALPIVSRYVALFLVRGNSDMVTQAADFLFIYGAIPTAPSVPLFAKESNCEPELMSATVVLCLFVSAPLMFVTTTLAVEHDPLVLHDLISQSAKWIGLASFICCFWLLLVTGLFKETRWYKYPMDLVSYIAFGIFFQEFFHQFCISQDSNTYLASTISYVFYGLSIFFRVGVVVWSSVISVIMYVQVSSPDGREKAAKYRPYYHMLAWTIPTLTAIPLIVAGKVMNLMNLGDTPYACEYRFGKTGYVVDACLASIAALVQLTGLIKVQQAAAKAGSVNENDKVDVELGTKAKIANGEEDEDPDLSMNQMGDVSDFPERFAFNVYTAWCFLNLSLTVILCTTFASGGFDYATTSGSIIQMVFILLIMNHGTGILLFMLFGFTEELQQELKEMYSRLYKVWRKAIFGVDDINFESMKGQLTLDLAKLMVALREGKNDVGEFLFKEKRRSGFNVYNDCAVGTEIVTFLVREGYAANRDEAVDKCRDLWNAGGIHHAVYEHIFHDKNFFYILEPSVELDARELISKASDSGSEDSASESVSGGQLNDIIGASITVVQARNLPRMDIFGSCNAYVVANIKDDTYNTRICKQRIHPIWKESHVFLYDCAAVTPTCEAKFTIMHSEGAVVKKAKVIGSVTIKLSDVNNMITRCNREIKQWYPIICRSVENKASLYLCIAPHRAKDEKQPFAEDSIDDLLEDAPMEVKQYVRRMSVTNMAGIKKLQQQVKANKEKKEPNEDNNNNNNNNSICHHGPLPRSSNGNNVRKNSMESTASSSSSSSGPVPFSSTGNTTPGCFLNTDTMDMRLIGSPKANIDESGSEC